MRVLDPEGDTQFTWKRDDPASVAAARRLFDASVRERNCLAFSVTGQTRPRGEQVRVFDATSERLLIVPPLVGG